MASNSIQHSEKSSLSTNESGPSTSAASWDLRHPGLIMKDGDGEVHDLEVGGRHGRSTPSACRFVGQRAHRRHECVGRIEHVGPPFR